MREIGEFKAKIYATSDKKHLKKNAKTKVYEYGTISVRDVKLTDFIGKSVVLKVFEDSEGGEK